RQTAFINPLAARLPPRAPTGPTAIPSRPAARLQSLRGAPGAFAPTTSVRRHSLPPHPAAVPPLPTPLSSPTLRPSIAAPSPAPIPSLPDFPHQGPRSSLHIRARLPARLPAHA